MYRRYYDGYNNYEQDRRAAEQGEVVVPRAADAAVTEAAAETSAGVQDAAEAGLQQSAARQVADGDLQFTIENGQAAGCRRRGGGLFDRLELDDLILIGVIILVLQDSVDDTLLLVVLGFLFLVGFLD